MFTESKDLLFDISEIAELKLSYVSDNLPGIRRKKVKNSFVYFYPNGRRIRDAHELRRIASLVVPPAYTDVWICPDANGHLQATGRDARGRKQYRYHRCWSAARDANKYHRMLDFGRALPSIRRRVYQDLRLAGTPRNKVIATALRLLEMTSIRVGNEEYVRANHSYGLTTLRDRHVNISGNEIRFMFRGKRGIQHNINVHDARLAKIVRQCKDIPGQELFQYLDDDGSHRSIHSTDVNNYLKEASGDDFTAKDFRTWAGSVFVMSKLQTLSWSTKVEAKKNLITTIKEAAAHLKNTVSICRKCYVHPALLEAYLQGDLKNERSRPTRWLTAEERDLLAFLRRTSARHFRNSNPHV